MSGPISALAERYQREMEWLLKCSHLGLPGAKKGALPAVLPAGVVAQIGTRTKDRRAIGVLIDSKPHVIAAPVSWPVMRRITREFVHNGGHPEDLIVWDYDPFGDTITATRTTLEHLLWTVSDQRDLEDR